MSKSARISHKRSTWIRLSFLFILLWYSSAVPIISPLVHAEPGAFNAKVKSRAMEKITAMEKLSGERLKLTISPDTGLATFLSTKRGKEIPIPSPAFGSAKERAESFMAEFGASFGLHKPSDFRALQERGLDEVGMEHVRLQQLYKGLPVTGGQLTVHMIGSLVTAVHAKTLGTIPSLETTPTIDAAGALEAAQFLMEEQLGVSTADFSDPRLEIFNRGHLEGTVRPTQLAWFIEARAPRIREFIWIHAHSGGVLLHFNQLPQGRERQVYDANSSSTLPGTLCRQEGDSASGDTDCDEAYNFSGDTYDYFFTEHGRDSYDDAGAPIISTVHSCPSGQSCPYANAFWNGTQMVYGDGFAAADDVVAHEITHAVTEHSANLFYYMQSGALNESYSDIFGETVDLTNVGGNDSPGVRWLIGEDLPLGTIRNMMTPTQFNDPGKMGDSQLLCDTSGLGGFSDRGGVHRNSGVPNHAYALMVDGGTYNGITITGIGLTKAAAIQYRALTHYLTSASNFIDNYQALDQSCSDLIGTHGITVEDCMEVTKALAAVEMADPWPCQPQVAEVPTFCPVNFTTTDLFTDDFENPGLANWFRTTQTGVGTWQYPHFTGDPFATSGEQYLWGKVIFFAVSDSTIEMAMDVTIPSDMARLQFNHAHFFTDMDGVFHDGGVVEYSTDGGITWLDAGSRIIGGQVYGGTVSNSTSPLIDRLAFVSDSFGYTASQLSLAGLVGQSFRVRFQMGTSNNSQDLGWFIDDVRIYQCDPVDNTIPSHTLSVGITGAGTGSVSNLTGDISCPSDCTEDFLEGTKVVLNATPEVGSQFSGWSGGGCIGTESCVVSMTQAHNIQATFTSLSAATLTINRIGSGSGMVTSTPAGIDCGTDCSETYAGGTSLLLTASPDPGSSFAGWAEVQDCGSGTVILNNNTTCTAIFMPSWNISRVSVNGAGAQGNSHSSTPSISLDGRYVAFRSLANNLVPGDTNGQVDNFVHDRDTGETTRVSVSSSGEQANDRSFEPGLSADGRYVVFSSNATNLVPEDTNATTDVFVHDRQTGTISRVSVSSSGEEGNQQSAFPVISADGRYVAFDSLASNLVPNDTNNANDVFIHDRKTGLTTRVSVDSHGQQVGHTSFRPSISANGRWVAFISWSFNLVPNDTNFYSDVFVHDRLTGQVSMVSVNSAGVQGNSGINHVAISADGQWVAFDSPSTNLVPGDTNDAPDVFLHNRLTGVTSRVSLDGLGNERTGSNYLNPSGQVIADGRFVVFEGDPFKSGTSSTDPSVYLHDHQLGLTVQLDLTSAGLPTAGVSRSPVISPNGKYLAFFSNGSDLVSGDIGSIYDIFVYEQGGLVSLPQTLTITLDGSGTGTVTSSVAGIDCGLDCSEDYLGGSLVTLTATAAAGSEFTGWSGGTDWSGTGCGGTDTCTVVMTQAHTVIATFAQLGPEYQQDPGSAGLVVVEAEHAQTHIPQGGHSWTEITVPLGFAGDSAMEATPDPGTLIDIDYSTTSPQLDFDINFVHTGTHYVWVRGWGASGASDSVHVGLNGQELPSSDRIDNFTPDWTWSNQTRDGPVATIEVATLGPHTLNVWMREDGFRIDKLLLTTNASFPTPVGQGPTESPRGGPPPSPLTVTVNQASGQLDPTNTSPINFAVVFSESVNDFATGDVTVGGTAGATTAIVTGSGTTYNVAVSGMTNDGTVTATIAARVATDAGGNDNAASTSTDNSVTFVIPGAEFQQDPGSEGLVVVEAEHAQTHTPQGGHSWIEITTPPGFAGDGAMEATPDPGTLIDINYATNSPQLDFDINFVYTGTHYVWVRGWGASGDADSVHVGLDGQELPSSDRIDNFTPAWTWSNQTKDGPVATIEVATLGPHTLNVWMREDGFRIDKLLLTRDASFPTPVGEGPAESPRGGPPPSSLTVTINQASGQLDPTNTSPINFAVVFSESVNNFATGDVTLGGAAGATTGIVTGSGTTYNVAVSGMTNDGTVTATIAAGVATDGLDNSNAPSTSIDNEVTYDGTSPTVTIEQAAGQGDPTNTGPINFDVVFSEAVTGFDDTDVTLGGSAAAGATPTVTGSGTTYTVAVSGMTGDGTISAMIGAGVATDDSGNGNEASTSIDNEVTYDGTSPTVTIEQANGQGDPTNASSINFIVLFSEAVSGFATGDVTLSGTAGATAGTVTEIAPNDGSTYTIAVSGMTSAGKVIVSVPAGVAIDSSNNSNTASTSTDNIVDYDAIAPVVTPPAPLTLISADGNPIPSTDPAIVSFVGSATALDNVDGVLPVTNNAPPQFPVGPTPVLFSSVDAAGNIGSAPSTLTVELASGPPIEVFVDSFEVGEWNGLWTEDNQNLWARTTPHAIDGSFSAQMQGSGGSTSNAVEALLTSTPIDLQGRNTATIDFSWFIGARFDTNEYIACDVSTDGGATWTEMARLRGNVDPEDTWHAVSLSAENITNLQIRFRSRASKANEHANVDMVRVVASGAGSPPMPPSTDAGTSTVTTSASAVPADGTSTATLTVTLLDSLSAPVAGHTVSLAQGPGSSTISAPSGLSDVAGQVTFTVSSTTSESVTYTATDDTDSVSLTQTASVTFTASPPSTDADTSTLTTSASSVPADGTSTATLTVTLLDSVSAPVAGHTVSLAQGPGSSTISAPSGLSDAAGQVTFTVSNATAESITYTATDDTDNVPLTQTATVTFTVLPTDAGTSTLTTSTSTVPADGTSTATLTVTLLDSLSAPVAGHTVSLAQGPGSSTISDVSGPSDAAGQVTFTVSSTTPESVTYTATDDTDSVSLTQTAAVTFTDLSTDAGTSTVTTSASSVPADGSSTATITVTLLDSLSAPVAGHTVSLAQGPGSSTISAPSGLSDAAGQVTFTVSNATAESVTYTATDDTNGVTLLTTVVVTFGSPLGNVEVFVDSFEVGEWNGLWTEDNQNRWARTTQRAIDGSFSAQMLGSGGSTSNAVEALLTSTPINLQGRNTATIDFSWLIGDRFDTNEYLAVEISTDGGATWTEMARLRGNVDPEDTWHAVSLSVENITSLQIRFRSRASKANEHANVDMVRVTGS